MKGYHKNKINNFLKLYIKNPDYFDQIIKDKWYEILEKIVSNEWPDDCWYFQGYEFTPTTTIQSIPVSWCSISYCFHYKSIPLDVIMHLCNNRLCVNPSHLMAGSQSENIQYARMFHDRYDKEILPDGYLTSNLAFKYLGYKSVKNLQYWIRSGQLKPYKLNGKQLYLTEDLNKIKELVHEPKKTNNKAFAT